MDVSPLSDKWFFPSILVVFSLSVLAALCSIEGLRSPTRDETCAPVLGVQSLNHWATREAPLFISFLSFWLCWPPLLRSGSLQLWWAGAALCCRLLTAGASPVAARGLSAHELQQLWHAGSAAGLWNLLDQGWNPCPLLWRVDSSPLYHQGSPSCPFFLDEAFGAQKF